MQEVKLSLASKLAKIANEIGAVKKGGRNSQQGYAFIEYAEIAGRIRELLDKYQVIILPEVEDYSVDKITNRSGGAGFHYIIKMNFKIVNGENNEDCYERKWLAEGADYGDKGINKTETAATKYFLMRLFQISEKGDDVDSETPDIQTATKSEVSKQGTATDKQIEAIKKFYLKHYPEPKAREMAEQYRYKTMAEASAELKRLIEEKTNVGN